MAKMRKTEIVMPLATNLMESTRAIGYSVETAIADIVDNCISAEATEIDIRFNFNTNPYLCIADNGYGMAFEELKNAMRYGSRSPSEQRSQMDLGRYGLGMKTASLSQCRRMSVYTKKEGIFSACCWDLDEVVKTNEWILLILELEDAEHIPFIKEHLEANDSCTVVVWENFDKLVGENTLEEVNAKMNDVSSHLSLVYHRFIAEKSVVIRVNNREIEAEDPFFLKPGDGCATSRKPMDTVSYLNGNVKVTPYILPLVKEMSAKSVDALGGDDGLRKNQGFYVYRNKRLLVWGTWFRLRRQTEKSKYARIQVDLSNAVDELWSLDIKKSQAKPPAIIKEPLKMVIDRISDDSLRQTSFRGRRQASQDGIEDMWVKEKSRDGIIYRVNRNHSLVKILLEDKKVELLLKYIEERLPVDALYNDLMEDKKIDNNQSAEEAEILSKLKETLAILAPDSNSREMFFETLVTSHPFAEHQQFLKSMKETVL